MEPWDHIPRFQFLECDLATLKKETAEYHSQRKHMKERFVGGVNLQKYTAAKK